MKKHKMTSLGIDQLDKKGKEKLAELILADVTKLPDDVLSDINTRVSAERNARHKRDEEVKRAKEILFNQYVYKNRKPILKLVPHHRHHCTDSDPDLETYPLCSRCYLLSMEAWDTDDVRIEFEVSIERIRR